MASGSQSPEHQQPRRNLSEAFEALCIASPEESIKEEKSDVFESNVGVSPTSVVAEMHTSNRDSTYSLRRFPTLSLAPDLRLNLSPYCVERISGYSIIHDINKEAQSMAAHDPLAAVESPTSEPMCPLVMAAQGHLLPIPQQRLAEMAPEQAVIDEEKWLLTVIAERSARETAAVSSTLCPATFLQAMGEKEYDVTISNSTRTQLWKPSRSWWEAKSGKNPWIEPASHNKRWRYLWPLIHYHKFMHKCIKKLKRNGVDVKLSLSPVSVFLREEVCAVSDHLAVVSLFGSDEWMSCLGFFQGWTVLELSAVRQYQVFVANLPLRSLLEPVDVDSPLLRNQIDETFLRTLAAQREQLRDSALGVFASVPSVSSSSKKTSPPPGSLAAMSMGHPPMYPRVAPLPVPRQIHGVRRPRYYPNGWYGWDGSSMPPQDTSSVHSELSANSYPQPPPFDPAMAYMYQNQHPSYFHPTSDNSQSTGGYTYPDQYGGWMDPTMAFAMHHQQYFGQYPRPEATVPESEIPVSAAEKTPFKYDPDGNNNMSPYWSHLDQATLAMGLATSAEVTPLTPRRRHVLDNSLEHQEVGDDEYPGFSASAPAPLLRQPYYGYDSVPPSPATQFMMSPQQNFAYNFGYGFSPTRMQRRASRTKVTPVKPLDHRSLSPTHTVDTAAETESLEPTSSNIHE